MNPKLSAMLVAVGVLTGGFLLITPQPATRSMLELRDAGIAEGQPVVSVCPERLTRQTKRRIELAQPGLLRPKQSYARVARVARCFGSEVLDGGPVGNCLKPNGDNMGPFTREVVGVLEDGGFATLEVFKHAEVIVPSLRQNLVGIDADAGVDDGGEEGVDDSLQYDLLSCSLTRCNTFDAGDGSNFCGRLNRLQMLDAPCRIPNGWRADGGWDESSPVDCRFGGPYGEMDGGYRWRGFNVGPSQYAAGAECVPVECSVVAGDVPSEWL